MIPIVAPVLLMILSEVIPPEMTAVPGAPVAPVAPVAPFVPVAPGGPTVPEAPSVPFVPERPATPGSPVSPFSAPEATKVLVIFVAATVPERAPAMTLVIIAGNKDAILRYVVHTTLSFSLLYIISTKKIYSKTKEMATIEQRHCKSLLLGIKTNTFCI